MDSLLEHDQDILAPPWGSLGRDCVLGLVATASKLLLNMLNTTRVINHTTFRDLVMHRPPGVGLLTISNHTSTFDDPGLPCALLPLSLFWTEHTHHMNRWTMCAQDICFTNTLFRQFFLNGKVLPVERGAGVDQSSITTAAGALGRGDWLHIFPEGRVTPSGHVGPFRQGIGKLICEARSVQGRDPIILPYFHSGMSRVMPFKSMIPRFGHEVVVAVGQPLDLGHITCRCNQPGEDQPQVWRDLAVALRHAVMELQDQVPPNPNQLNRPEVAEYERMYHERRRAREQQHTAGSPELAMMVPGQEQQQQQQDDQQKHGSLIELGEAPMQRQRLKHKSTQEQEQMQHQQQQQQMVAVIRRILRQHQVESDHDFDLDMQQERVQPHAWQQQLQRRWEQGQHILSSWQQLQDRQVAVLLRLSKRTETSSAIHSSSGINSRYNCSNNTSSSSSSGSSSQTPADADRLGQKLLNQKPLSRFWLRYGPWATAAINERQRSG